MIEVTLKQKLNISVHWWPSDVVWSMVRLLSLWHILHFHSQFYKLRWVLININFLFFILCNIFRLRFISHVQKQSCKLVRMLHIIIFYRQLWNFFFTNSKIYFAPIYLSSNQISSFEILFVLRSLDTLIFNLQESYVLPVVLSQFQKLWLLFVHILVPWHHTPHRLTTGGIYLDT